MDNDTELFDKDGKAVTVAFNPKKFLDQIEEFKNQALVSRLDITVDFINNVRPVSYSSLKHFRSSPAHYVEYLLSEKKDTEATMLGKVVHMMILQPERVDEDVFIMPELNLRTNADKATKARLLEENKGKLLITKDTYLLAIEITKSVYRDKDAMYYINRLIRTEFRLEWTDPETKLKSVGYVDGASDPDDTDFFILDLKTTNDAEKDSFIRSAANFEYHLQCGGYMLGYKRRYFAFPDFIWIVVETSAPYGVNVFRADPKYIQEAQEEYQNTLLAFKYCMDNNEFHKTYDFHRFNLAYNRMELPKYVKKVFG